MSLKTVRQNRFALALLDGLSPVEAAQKAGYSPDIRAARASELAQKPYIQNRLTVLQQAQAESSMVTRDRVIAAHAEIAFGLDEATIADRQRSLDALARMLGMDAPKQVEVGKPGDFANLDDRQLEEKIANLMEGVVDLVEGQDGIHRPAPG